MDWRDLARGQAGAISRSQLFDSGLSKGAIRGLIARRELLVLLPAVYTPRAAPSTFLQRAWAVQLWSGGVISHGTAAKLWDLPVAPGRQLHVTVDRSVQLSAPGVRVHRVALPGARLTANVEGLTVTTRTATIVDLLRSEPIDRARNLFDRALARSWVDRAFLEESVEAGRGLAGNAQLRRLLRDAEPGAQAESERVLHRILRRAGLAGWVAQYRIALGPRVAYADLAFPRQRLVVEVDGRITHDERSDAFEDDRLRQNELQIAGWRVLRFTWRMLQDPPRVVARIQAALAADLGS